MDSLTNIGMGFEDDDLLIRCVQSNLKLDDEVSRTDSIKEIESFKLDGDLSYIHLKSKKQSTLKMNLQYQ